MMFSWKKKIPFTHTNSLLLYFTYQIKLSVDPFACTAQYTALCPPAFHLSARQALTDPLKTCLTCSLCSSPFLVSFLLRCGWIEPYRSPQKCSDHRNRFRFKTALCSGIVSSAFPSMTDSSSVWVTRGAGRGWDPLVLVIVPLVICKIRPGGASQLPVTFKCIITVVGHYLLDVELNVMI